MSLRYCFEKSYIPLTLSSCRKSDLAVIDTDIVPASTVKKAVERGVWVYGYLNACALEDGRSYYQKYRRLRLAKYDGWPGEYWVDVTDKAWQEHLISTAKAIKTTGAVGLYLDNTDLYGFIRDGEIKKQYSRALPSAGAVYRALCDVILAIHKTGLIVMPNGGDIFVKKFITEHPGIIATINQEGLFYEDFKKQPSSETAYRKEYMKWCAKRMGGKVRGIEYCKKASEIAKVKAYYAAHGWDVYISKHTDLRGD